MNLVLKMMKKRKWGVRGGQTEVGRWDGLSRGCGMRNNVVRYQIVGVSGGSKRITIK
jgi:hypothetical protein